jgi:pyruvate formate lyase activating enzyme
MEGSCAMSTTESLYPGRWWHALPDGRVQCDLCPRDCHLHEGQRGACFVRQMVNGAMVLTTYGRSSGFCIDPIEKKPLNHFYPGSSILSFGTAGCNLACKFCQNWDISKSKDMDRLMDRQPGNDRRAARRYGAERRLHLQRPGHLRRIRHRHRATPAASSGIRNRRRHRRLHPPRTARELFAVMDAANVDLKAFTEDFYHKLCVGHLQPVLDTLAYIHHETDCWLEITTLLIPGQNDSPPRSTPWHLGRPGTRPDVPLHFTAFHPDWKIDDLPPTPPPPDPGPPHRPRRRSPPRLHRQRPRPEGGTTFCPNCQAALIVRDWYEIRRLRPDAGRPLSALPDGHRRPLRALTAAG